MTDPLARRVRAKSPVILDGGLASELERKGADLDHPLWSARLLVDRPASILDVHLDYLAAGAECITTAGYQASVPGFVASGVSEGRARKLYGDTFRLALDARARFLADDPGRASPLIAASVGPYGAYLADGSEYRGAYGVDRDALERFHRPRVETSVELIRDASPADAVIAFETIPSLDEAILLAELLEPHDDVFAWASFSCRDDAHTCEGQPITACAAALASFRCIAAIGVNCTAPRHVPALVRRIREHTEKPVLAYPNAGETYDADRRAWAGDRSPGFVEIAREAAAAGASLVGGCCRTTPEDIARLVAAFGPR